MASKTTPSNGYDSSLVKDAPALTKLDKQEGYDIDLLEQGAPKSVDAHGAGRSSRRPPGAAVPAGVAAGGGLAAKNVLDEKPIKKQPFYRTKKGLIIIGAIVFVVIIAVALGAGLGIANANKNNNDDSEAANTTFSGKPETGTVAPTRSVGGDGGKPSSIVSEQPVGTGIPNPIDQDGGDDVPVSRTQGVVLPSSKNKAPLYPAL